MPVEIREVVLRARVTESEPPSPGPADGESYDPDRLKADILATCERMIRDELLRARSR